MAKVTVKLPVGMTTADVTFFAEAPAVDWG
jgi:hypothetical protein